MDVWFKPQGADSLLPPLRVAMTGKNHLNEEITPLLPTGIGERFIQTISNLGHAALLRRRELPPLKVHKIENFFGSDFEFCVISLLVMLKY
jgi:hypothetical protein